MAWHLVDRLVAKEILNRIPRNPERSKSGRTFQHSPGTEPVDGLIAHLEQGCGLFGGVSDLIEVAVGLGRSWITAGRCFVRIHLHK